MYYAKHRYTNQLWFKKIWPLTAASLLLSTSIQAGLSLNDPKTQAATTTQTTNAANNLQTLINGLANYNSETYTDASWSNLLAAKDNAQAVLANTNATAVDIQTAASQLNNALTNLQLFQNPPIRELLLDYYYTLQHITQGSAPSNTWTNFTTQLNDARDLLQSPTSTDAQLQAAYESLANDYKALINQQVLPTNNTNNGTTTIADNATAGAVSDNESASTQQASYTNVNGVGQVFFTTNSGIPLYDAPNGNIYHYTDGTQHLLANGTAWKVFRKATLSDGTTWYEVGQNQWVSAQYMMIQKSGVATINFAPGYSINLWQLQPDGVHFTGRRLTNGTAWKIYGSIMVGGVEYFNLGANQWVNSTYVTLS
ncbi:FIVAR domain-containing protein [Lactobacillus sp. CC-MHH1034]|uniref:FIVAR domain-containing protein n=1 Tax=Agrilactobacillus fermenti TaxID=2586909 RepID=UPI001E4DE4AA|nr:FIVAR domain-containing protein [Agrilactobacillus fermenti]MCD2256537.1 FIVAR domain-containing protein [Agrilactobacillus fermenti]